MREALVVSSSAEAGETKLEKHRHRQTRSGVFIIIMATLVTSEKKWIEIRY